VSVLQQKIDRAVGIIFGLSGKASYARYAYGDPCITAFLDGLRCDWEPDSLLEAA
jgi:hypothetical protein